jgi:hypothetical protein
MALKPLPLVSQKVPVKLKNGGPQTVHHSAAQEEGLQGEEAPVDPGAAAAVIRAVVAGDTEAGQRFANSARRK